MPSYQNEMSNYGSITPVLEDPVEGGTKVKPEDIVLWGTRSAKWFLNSMISCAEASIDVIDQTEITVEIQSRENSPRGDQTGPKMRRQKQRVIDQPRLRTMTSQQPDRSPFGEQIRNTFMAQKAAPTLLKIGNYAAIGVNKLLFWGQDSNPPQSNDLILAPQEDVPMFYSDDIDQPASRGTSTKWSRTEDVLTQLKSNSDDTESS